MALRDPELRATYSREYYKKYREKPGVKEKARAATKRWSEKNREAIRERRMKQYYANHEAALRQQRNQKYKTAYGITLDEFEQLNAEQNGLCAICSGPSTDGKSLHVDHDHISGRVRGLLCSHCNRALGGFKDDEALLLNAAKYIREARQ